MIKLKNISIKVKLMVYSAFTIGLTALVISIILYNTSESIIRKQVGNQVKITTELIIARNDKLLQEIQRTAFSFAFSSRMKMVMKKHEHPLYEDTENIKNLSKSIEDLYYLNSTINSIYIYNTKYKYYITHSMGKVRINEEDKLYQFIIENFSFTGFDNIYRWISGIGNIEISLASLKQKNDRIATSLIVPILNDSRELLGVLIFNINEDSIASTYDVSDLGLGYNFVIQDQDGIIISSNKKDEIGKPGYSFQEENSNGDPFFSIIDGKTRLVTRLKSYYNEWEYIYVIPIDELMKGTVDTLKKTTLLVVAIAIFMLFSLSLLMNYIFYKPVKNSIESIKNSLYKKNTSERIDRKDEIGFVFNSFFDILDENTELLKNIFEKEIFAKDAELKMLESQINPHFLYNSLDGAICMIRLGEIDKARTMLNALIKLYRMTLDNQTKIVSIKEEIENIKNYNIIQDIRYNRALTIECNIQEGILKYQILKLILQPLVENAIQHGIGKGKKTINISISAYTEKSNIVFKVRDDGLGIPAPRLIELKSIIEKKESGSDKYYALHNINRRIKLYYGEEFGLTIDSVENEWTESKITIPIVI